MTAFPELDLPTPTTEIDVLRFLPTHSDGRYLATEVGVRHVMHRYPGQVARAADELGYFGVLLPTGQSCEDSWVVASSLVPLTERLRFLAVRPGLYDLTIVGEPIQQRWVILASPNTFGHSPKARLVVTMTEVCS